jgi:hypothetical protein
MPSPTVNQVHVDRALTNLSIAYMQERPPFSDLIFPRVPVDFQSDVYFKWAKADLWRDDARLRAPGADFAQTKLGLTTDSYRADQYALEYPIPDEIVKNADAAVRLEEVGTRTLQGRLSLRKDRAFAADFVKTGVWATDKVGTTDFVKWNDATSDPAGDIQAAMETILNATGDVDGMQFKLLIGSLVRSRLVNHPDAIDRIKYTEKANVAAVDAMMAGWLGVDELVVARRRYTTSAEGDSATYAAIVSDSALLVAVPTGPGLETPSAGYTFEWNEDGKGPMYIERYRYDPKKSEILRGITYFDQKAVATDLGYFFSDCVD